MEEDNDEQWLYGEEATTENLGTIEDAPETDVITDKVDESSRCDPQVEENTTDIEPPVIKPLEENRFEDDALPPGEEEVFVPLDPPVIAAPETTNEKEDENIENDAVNGDNEEVKDPEKKLSEGEEEEEDDDDNINVVIGDIHTAPNYQSNLHVKRGNLLTLTKVYHHKNNYYPPQQCQQTGKFATDDFESVGAINGVPAHDFNLDNLEDKPWRKPGADITDYFNYGFNEETWRAYCERQKRIRVHESGSGLIPMNQQSSNNVNIIPNVSVPPPNMMAPPVGVSNSDLSSGSINVIGGPNTRRSNDFAKENTIQVMTADRREYSKKNFTPDMSVPPPPVVPPPYGLPPGIPPPFPPMNQYGLPPSDYFPPEMDPYYQSYEPQADPGWPGPNWNANVDMKNIMPLNGGERPMNGGPDPKPSTSDGLGGVKIKTEPEDKDMGHDRDRDRSRDYDRDREGRHRDRSHRHRSRSRSHERRSRKHKSRSRSPGYRNHKKKKSKKSERSKSDSD